MLAIYPDGFLPIIATTLTDYAGTLGLKGDAGGAFNFDLSLSYGRNEFEFGVENSLNRSFGATSQTKFDAGALEYEQFTWNADMRRTFEVGFLSSLSVAGGVEFRVESFGIRPGEPASYESGTAGGAPGVQVSRASGR